MMRANVNGIVTWSKSNAAGLCTARAPGRAPWVGGRGGVAYAGPGQQAGIRLEEDVRPAA